jgi:hypothetical protein
LLTANSPRRISDVRQLLSLFPLTAAPPTEYLAHSCPSYGTSRSKRATIIPRQVLTLKSTDVGFAGAISAPLPCELFPKRGTNMSRRAALTLTTMALLCLTVSHTTAIAKNNLPFVR